MPSEKILTLTTAEKANAGHVTPKSHIIVFSADGKIEIPIYKLADGRYQVQWRDPITGERDEKRKKQRADAIAFAQDDLCPRLWERKGLGAKENCRTLLQEPPPQRQARESRDPERFPSPRAISISELSQTFTARDLKARNEAPFVWFSEAALHRIESSDIENKSGAILTYLAHARIAKEIRSSTYTAHCVHLEARSSLKERTVREANHDLKRIGLLLIKHRMIPGTNCRHTNVYGLCTTCITPMSKVPDGLGTPRKTPAAGGAAISTDEEKNKEKAFKFWWKEQGFQGDPPCPPLKSAPPSAAAEFRHDYRNRNWRKRLPDSETQAG